MYGFLNRNFGSGSWGSVFAKGYAETRRGPSMFLSRDWRDRVPAVRSLIYWVLFFLAAPLASLHAQELTNIRFSAFSLKGKIGEVSVLSSGKVETFRVGDYRRSKTIEYLGSPEIIFFTGPLTEDGMPTGVIARTKINPELEQPLFLFAKHAKGFSVIQIEDAPSRFPAGTVRFMNLTGRKHEVHIGIGEEAKERLRIPPLAFRNYQMQEADHGNLRLRIAKRQNGEMKMLRDCRIFPELTQRYVYFIYQPNPDKPRIQISSLAGGA
jgi:hypothetical protein